MVLHPALGGLRLNDDLHKPPQDSSALGAGSGSLRVKPVPLFPYEDTRLLHGFDFFRCPAADLRVVHKSYSFPDDRQLIAQFFRVICHNDRHLFPRDSSVRGKIERGSERSRENQKERLQYLAVGTVGTVTPQGAEYGRVTDRAAG